VIPTPEELHHLHRQCLAALRVYVSQANKTCKLLAKATKCPVSMEMRHEILEQRKAENEARNRYMEIRDRALRIVTEAEADMF
jgi:predicted negative regulator of RcsB-dependent stress response